MTSSPRCRINWRTLGVAILLVLAPLPTALADGDKAEETPRFWQRDPEADFENEGRNHCGPASIGVALVYLATARGFDDLVESTDHDGQIALITELSEDMATDPVEGTNPDKILTGLRSYAKKRGVTFERLELATWRGVSASNRKHLIGTKPKLSWMTAAAEDPDAVVIFNFGWYKEDEEGGHTRHSGHWVSVVGAGPGARQFEVHNPALKPERQKINTRITLTPVGDDFVMTNGAGEETEMTGYYQAEGPGLPFSKEAVSAAVLDSVIVFKLNEE